MNRVRKWSSSLVFATVVRLCTTREGKLQSGLGITKSWRFVSDSEIFVSAVNAKHGTCKCQRHIQPQYRQTAFYPASLCESLVSAMRAATTDLRETSTNDDVRERLVWSR